MDPGEWNLPIDGIDVKWYVGGDLSPRATGPTYTPLEDQVGFSVHVLVTVTARNGASETIYPLRDRSST